MPVGKKKTSGSGAFLRRLDRELPAPTKPRTKRRGIAPKSDLWEPVLVPPEVRRAMEEAENPKAHPCKDSPSLLESLREIERKYPLPPDHKPLGIDLADRKQVRALILSRMKNRQR
jgi:hypothetical protein